MFDQCPIFSPVIPPRLQTSHNILHLSGIATVFLMTAAENLGSHREFPSNFCHCTIDRVLSYGCWTYLHLSMDCFYKWCCERDRSRMEMCNDNVSYRTLSIYKNQMYGGLTVQKHHQFFEMWMTFTVQKCNRSGQTLCFCIWGRDSNIDIFGGSLIFTAPDESSVNKKKFKKSSSQLVP